MSVAGGLKRRLTAARERSRLLDHLVTTLEHYSKAECSVLAGAITFFGFLSFFPILAIVFSIIGLIAGAYPDAEQAVTDAMHSVFPKMIGTKEGQIDPTQFKDTAATAGVIGVLTLSYTGLGWLSALRQSLQTVFELPRSKAHSFVAGKLVDLLVLAVIGLVLLVSVALSSTVTSQVDEILRAASLSDVEGLYTALRVVGVGLAIAASTVMFVVAFRVLAKPAVSSRALWSGAVLAAIGFEILKLVASYLIAATKQDPAFAVFGTALILLVWINFFSRLVLLGASWAATADRAAGRTLAPTSAAYAVAVTTASGVPSRQAAEAAVQEAHQAAAEQSAGTREMVRSAAVVAGVSWLLHRTPRRED